MAFNFILSFGEHVKNEIHRVHQFILQNLQQLLLMRSDSFQHPRQHFVIVNFIPEEVSERPLVSSHRQVEQSWVDFDVPLLNFVFDELDELIFELVDALGVAFVELFELLADARRDRVDVLDAEGDEVDTFEVQVQEFRVEHYEN